MAACVPTYVGETVFGNQRVLYGTYTASGNTVGTLTLGLNAVVAAFANSSAGAYATAISWTAGVLSITPAASDTAGYWVVYGY